MAKNMGNEFHNPLPIVIILKLFNTTKVIFLIYIYKYLKKKNKATIKDNLI